MKRFLIVVSVFIVFGSAPATESRAAGDAYGSDYPLAGLGVLPVEAPFTLGGIVRIDPQTGEGTPAGTLYRFEFDGVGSNLSSDSRGRVYNIGNILLSAEDWLNRFDAASGEIVSSEPLSGRPAGFLWPSAIAFSADDTLYSLLPAELGTQQLLTTIDREGGTYNVVTALDDSAPVILDMTFDSNDDLYALGRDVGLLKIDVSTGDTQIIGGDPIILYAGALECTPDDRLFATAAGQLLAVDPATGKADEIGPISPPYAFVGLATIPEPSGILLLSWLAPAALLARSRRRVRGS